jgi:hypothetical protein
VRRRFVPFDTATITSEFDRLPEVDRLQLLRVMARFEAEPQSFRPALVSKYEDNLWRIRHENPRYSGRAIFSIGPVVGDVETGESVQSLRLLVVYKKEGNDVPKRVLDTARRRM